jgi:hypothetical protein
MVTRTDGPFEYWEVTGDAVRAAAEAPGSDADVIQSLAGELEGDETRAANAIEGDIEAGVKANTTAAKTTAQSLAAKGQYAVGLLKQFGADVDTFDTTVNQINVDYNTRYDNTIFGMHHQPEYRSGEEKIDYAAVGASIKADLMARYHKAEGVIDDAADTIASMFKQGPTDANVRDLIRAGLIPLASASLYPTLVLTDDDKREALKATIKGMTPAQQAQYVKDHKEIDAKTAEVISPEAQTILANDVAEDVKNKTVDEETVRILGLMQNSAPFAHAFYGQVTPNQMTSAIEKLSSDAYPNGPFHSGVGYGAGTEPLDKNKIDLYKNFLSAAGGTLATYSKGTGEYAPPADAGISWGKAITDEDHPQNAGALSLLLREGGEKHEFDGKFLSDVADTVYEYEQDHKDDQPWGSRGSQVIDPDAKIGNSDDNTWGVRSFDAMANVLGAMKSSPDAAQMFFADGYPDDNHDGHPDTDKPNSRLEYLLTERTFSKDLADWKSGDEGDGLGLALEAATVGHHERNQLGADLASDAFTLIAEKSGTGDGWGPDDKWHTWPGMTDSLGTIAAGYVDDIYDTIDNNPPGAGPHLQISQENLDKLLGEIGRGEDKTGIETLTAAAVIEGNDRIGEHIRDWRADHPGEPLTMEALSKSGLGSLLEGQGSTNGEILKHLLDKSVLVDVDDEKLAATRAAYVSKAFDIATSFAPGADKVLGATASEFSKTAYGTLSGEALSLLGEQVSGTPDALSSKYTEDQTKALPNQIEYGLVNQLHQSGYLGKQGDYSGIPDSLLTGPEGHQIIRPDLYDADGIEKFDTKGLTDAQVAQIKEDWRKWQESDPRAFSETLSASVLNGFDRAVRE